MRTYAEAARLQTLLLRAKVLAAAAQELGAAGDWAFENQARAALEALKEAITVAVEEREG